MIKFDSCTEIPASEPPLSLRKANIEREAKYFLSTNKSAPLGKVLPKNSLTRKSQACSTASSWSSAWFPLWRTPFYVQLANGKVSILASRAAYGTFFCLMQLKMLVTPFPTDDSSPLELVPNIV